MNRRDRGLSIGTPPIAQNPIQPVCISRGYPSIRSLLFPSSTQEITSPTESGGVVGCQGVQN